MLHSGSRVRRTGRNGLPSLEWLAHLLLELLSGHRPLTQERGLALRSDITACRAVFESSLAWIFKLLKLGPLSEALRRQSVTLWRQGWGAIFI
jgi:hypothetical protein